MMVEVNIAPDGRSAEVTHLKMPINYAGHVPRL